MQYGPHTTQVGDVQLQGFTAVYGLVRPHTAPRAPL